MLKLLINLRNAFPPEIESQLSDINDLDHLVTKANQLVQLFKQKQTTSSSLLSHSAQEQLSQNVLSTNKFQKEYKIPIGSKWTNDNSQKSKIQYQNSCNLRNPGWFNNQTQAHKQPQYLNRGNHSSNQGNFNDQNRSNTMYTP